LASVIFESGASLQAMIERREVDLNGVFEIYLFGRDGVLSFPGYSVSTISDVDNSVQLVKNA
jgi:hypothetical protein